MKNFQAEKITVYGCGRWGSFLAWYLHGLGFRVVLYGRRGGTFSALRAARKNEYLALPDAVVLTDDLGAAATNADIHIVSIESQQLRAFLAALGKFPG
ncbi:MAG: glycerol-3-phosphate dehydrogenase, partial [Firmicutes bacterium]|nr:glycerol-3-phosphate dehydrogenase [Bacillota bacterium]